jgi:sulfate adenylyltransferase subunit 2
VRGDSLLTLWAKENDAGETRSVRFRTVGDISCTLPVESTAKTIAEIITETLAATVSERGATRLDDRTTDASMEKRKLAGYF